MTDSRPADTECTRHLTATVYVVNGDATALHEHPGLGIRVAPGGHVARDELPHEAGLLADLPETGLDPVLVDDTVAVEAPAGGRYLTPDTRYCTTSTSARTVPSATSTST